MKKYKMTRNTKEEKRRLLLTKKNVKQETRIAKYGSDSVAVVAKDMNHRFIAAFMALVFAISCMVVGINFATKADDDTTILTANMTPSSLTGSGFVTSKKLSVNESGNYDLTLEAYSTGATIVEQVPTDIVLVLDQSGSMAKDDMPISYNDGVTTNWYIPQGESDVINKYYYDGENYYRVYRKRGYMYEYIEPNSVYIGKVLEDTPLSWFQSSSDVDQSISAQYYYLYNGTFYPTTVTVKGSTLRYDATIEFTDSNGSSYYVTHDDSPYYRNFATGNKMTSGTLYDGANLAVKELFGYSAIWGWKGSMFGTDATAKANQEKFQRSYTYAEVLGINTGMYIQSMLFKRHVGYSQLCYKDENGNEHILIDADYCDSSGAPVGGLVDANGKPTETYTSTNDATWYGTLYTPTSTTTRLAALNNALKSFIAGVANQTNGDGTKPDHRIAVVGFSSSDSVYKNTELLSGTDLTITDTAFEDDGAGSTRYSLDEPNHSTAHNGKQYSEATSPNYANALLQVNDSTQYEKLEKAVDSITAYGGTEPKYGFYMAHNILKKRAASSLTYTKKDGTSGTRNQVIIFFTDGQPGNYSSDNQYAYANETVDAAYQIKTDSTIGDTPIYSIGTFGEADANPLLYQKTIRRSNYSSDNAYLEARLNMLYSLDYDQTVTDSGITQTSSGYSVSSSAVFTAKFRIWQADSTNFPTTASDTIADYMETVSSKYSNAEAFVDPAWYGNGTKSGTYASMVQAVRGNAASGQYYYLATNQNALYKAFSKIFESVSSNVSNVTLDSTNSLVRDVLSNEFQKTDSTVVSLFTSSGSITSEGVVGNWGTEVLNPSGVSANWTDEKTLDVTGFDFSENYISTEHPGNKLIIRISNIVPVSNVSGNTNTGDLIYSNTAEIGIFIDGNESPLAIFPQPSISRHSYTLNVGSDNTAATFDYATKLVGSGGNLDDVIVVVPETVTEGGTTTTVEHRYPYADFITNNDTGEFGNWGNGTVFYYENVPAGYTIHTSLKTDDNAYTYSVAYDDDQAGTQPRAMIPAQATVRDDFSFDDHQINITSEANTRNAFLTLTTEGLYANTERQFPIGMEITGYTGDITYKLNGSSSLTTLHFSDGVLTNPPDDLKLKHGDQVEFTNLPANSTVTITPSDDPGNVYTWTAQLDSGEATGTAKEGTIDRDGHAFHVVYKRGTVTETGVSDDGSHSFTYILAGIGVLTGGAGAAYVYRKKDEFVER